MRMLLQKVLPVIAATALVACAIPDDGFSELSGTIQIPGTLLPLVIQPGDAAGDCAETDNPWGTDPAIGDVEPTLYVGLYPHPVNPLDGRIFNDNAVGSWRFGCGEIDHDDDPVTPPIEQTGSCPIGGTTARYVQTIAGTAGGAVFEFKALQLETGTQNLFAWLDNKCRDDNSPTNNLVWDISGPPGPLDNQGDTEAGDEYDIGMPLSIEVDIGGGGNSLDDPLILTSAWTLAGSLPPEE